ncbi:MAG: hypothetical protein NW215_12000 [Hyphomicrobiales bacterium]|nr:hypothetical protein [Hyphomicrobiales bacterium]
MKTKIACGAKTAKMAVPVMIAQLQLVLEAMEGDPAFASPAVLIYHALAEVRDIQGAAHEVFYEAVGRAAEDADNDEGVLAPLLAAVTAYKQ